MKITETNEWIKVDKSTGTVGVTEFVRNEIGEIVYVELPEVGRELVAGEEVVVLESTKAAFDIYSPVSGSVIEVNERLVNQCSCINTSPEKEGWLFKVKLSNPEELISLQER